MNSTIHSLDHEADQILRRAAETKDADSLLQNEAKLWWRLLVQEAGRIAGESERSVKMRQLIGTPLEFEKLEGPDLTPGFQVIKSDFPAVYARAWFYGLTVVVDWETVEAGVINQNKSTKYETIRINRTAGSTFARNERGETFQTINDLAMYILRPCWAPH